jgi:protein TonB
MKQTLIWTVVVLIAVGTAWAFQTKSGQTTKEAKDITKPVLEQKVDPKYPEEAKKNRIQGVVKVEAVIDKSGSVIEAKASESPDPSLAKAAVDAVRQWKFKPAVNKKGEPVQVNTTVTVNFRLK